MSSRPYNDLIDSLSRMLDQREMAGKTLHLNHKGVKVPSKNCLWAVTLQSRLECHFQGRKDEKVDLAAVAEVSLPVLSPNFKPHFTQIDLLCTYLLQCRLP